MCKYLILAILPLVCFTVKAEDKPININTKRTLIVGEFHIVCEYDAHHNTCTEIVTTGLDSGKSRTHVGPGSVIPTEFADWNEATDSLDPLAEI